MTITTEHRASQHDTSTSTPAELEASNSVEDEFLGLVSHELRTPVTTILRQRPTPAGPARPAGSGPARFDAGRHRSRGRAPPRDHREPAVTDPARDGHPARARADGARPRDPAVGRADPASLSRPFDRLQQPAVGDRGRRADPSRAAGREPGRQRREVQPGGLADRRAGGGRRGRGPRPCPRSGDRLSTSSQPPACSSRSTEARRPVRRPAAWVLGWPPAAGSCTCSVGASGHDRATTPERSSGSRCRLRRTSTTCPCALFDRGGRRIGRVAAISQPLSAEPRRNLLRGRVV